jgi:hypothetical protein
VHLYTDGLSQGEVKNRFGALATMVDSRGWAIKNIGADDDSDRLVQPAISPIISSGYSDSTPDVLDESSGAVAKQFDSMIEKSEQKHKSETLKLVEEARRKATAQNIDETQLTSKKPSKKPTTNNDKAKSQDFWFMNNKTKAEPPVDPTLTTFQNSTVVTPGADAAYQSSTPATVNTDDTSTLSEEELLNAVHKKQERDALQTAQHHGKVVNPDGTVSNTNKNEDTNSIKSPREKESINTVTPPTDPDILNLAQSNDLNVETLSRQANKKKDLGDDEVVISLH